MLRRHRHRYRRGRGSEGRVPIVRIETDGSTTDGTAAYSGTGPWDWTIGDFRDLDGEPLSLPPLARFEFPNPFRLTGEEE